MVANKFCSASGLRFLMLQAVQEEAPQFPFPLYIFALIPKGITQNMTQTLCLLWALRLQRYRCREMEGKALLC